MWFFGLFRAKMMSIPEAPYGRVKKGDNKYVYNIYDTRKTFKRTILDKYY